MPTKIGFVHPQIARIEDAVILHYVALELKEALHILYPQYRIYQYGGIVLPLDPLADRDGRVYHKSGLVIQEGWPRQGQEVERFSDFDLMVTGSILPRPRVYEEMREHFKRMVLSYMLFRNPGDIADSCYLDGYHERKMTHPDDPIVLEYELRVHDLLEIAEACLDISHPTVSDLNLLVKRDLSVHT